MPSWTQASGGTAWGCQGWKSLEFQPGPSPSSSCPSTHLPFGFSTEERKGAESLLWVIRDMHVDPLPGTPSPWVPGGQLCFSPFPVQGPQLASFLGVKKNNAGSMG